MNKEIEADLISIAHRILKLKGKSDVNLLFVETQKLFEKLSVLKFLEEHSNSQEPTFDKLAILSNLNTVDKQNLVTPSINYVELDMVINSDSVMSIIPDINVNLPSSDVETPPLLAYIEPMGYKDTIVSSYFEETYNDSFIPVVKDTEEFKTSFEDLINDNYIEPEFVKKEEISTYNEIEIIKKEEIEVEEIPTFIPDNSKEIDSDIKTSTSLDVHSDDDDFVTILFNGNSDDYKSVFNQLITFESYHEATKFLEEIVKPDYNFWLGKYEYERKFLDIVKQKYN
jgi:hypothetical protein